MIVDYVIGGKDIVVIWINGACGVGKSTIAKEIKRNFSDDKIEILDSDYYYQPKNYFYRKDEKSGKYICGGATRQQNNKIFIEDFKKILEEKFKDRNKQFIIPMSLTDVACKDLIKINKNILHIILTADKEIIESRIKFDSDPSRDKKFNLEWLEQDIWFLNNNFEDAIRIDTNNKNIRDTADEIIQYLKNRNIM